MILMFGFLKGGKRTTITGINVKLQGYTHQLPGLESTKEKIEIEIPFKNKTHADIMTEAKVLKVEKAKPLVLQEIKVSEPFKVSSIEPNTPLEVKPDESIKIKITLDAPAHNYSGPLNVNLVTPGEEVIHIELARTILVWKGQKKEIESSARMFNAQKGGIFAENVQLYKIMKHGDVAKSIEVSFPFKFVSTDPKLPVTISDANSHILGIYLQAPQHSYSGDLEIKIA